MLHIGFIYKQSQLLISGFDIDNNMAWLKRIASQFVAKSGIDLANEPRSTALGLVPNTKVGDGVPSLTIAMRSRRLRHGDHE